MESSSFFSLALGPQPGWGARMRRVILLFCVALALLASAAFTRARTNHQTREILLENAEAIQEVIEWYADAFGGYPSVATFHSELRFLRVPINPFTWRRTRLVEADRHGATRVSEKARAGHLGYYSATPERYTLFIYDRHGHIQETLTGVRSTQPESARQHHAVVFSLTKPPGG